MIMVTGEEDETVLEQAFLAGAMDYIVKPFSQIELKARVKSALELRQERQKRSQRESELEDATKSLKAANKEFAVILSETDYKGLTEVAERIRREIQGLKIEHENSEVSDYVTVSLRAAVACLESKLGVDKLEEAADKELCRAKEDGRNRVKVNKKLVTGEVLAFYLEVICFTNKISQ